MNKRDPYNFDNNKNPLSDNLLKLYRNDNDLQKALEDELEKGGKRAVIGERREFAGRMYIKTAEGWKFVGKGTGSKAKDHEKHVRESKAERSEEHDSLDENKVSFI